ncbi:cact [Drosophila busckii]|uniref:Cact n=2 Tax=Drosophila busckii TaxID=30019 RepID=A0A0M4E657_DROBS|nr:cact [Drosophila busckii]
MAPHPCLLNIQNDVAQTPLHLAALTAQPTILRMLLLAGAEPTVRDRHGNTPLHLSCISGEKQCVRALTEKFGASEIHEAHRQYGHRSNDKSVSSLSYARLPADLEIRNYDGERCVHLAAEAGHIDILRILVSHGADINAREGKSGRTPLHIAIEYCNEDLANFLLDECEKLNLETATYAGLTAYQVASILNKSHMQNILEKRGAETLTPPDSDYDSSDIEDLDDTKMYDRFGDPRYFVSYNGGNPMTVA